MTDEPPEYGDALTAPFWRAAAQHHLVLQRCRVDGRYQFYPRPFCLACGSDRLEWADAKGTGTIYAVIRVHQQVSVELEAPYFVAIVELDEGPRLLTNILAEECRIGDRVEVRWHDRADKPPMPVFVIRPQ